jgi:SAM-dependent methyltransferase
MREDDELKRRFFPEANISGFSHVDGSVALYSQIAAVLKPDSQVLDFGAGRGETPLQDPVDYRRNLMVFTGRCAHVEGCDVEVTVLRNPFLDHAEVVLPNERLPFDDDRFDVVVARSVFEHLDNPAFTASELLRVTKPGGLIAASTPNKWGYIAAMASLVPNRMHRRALRAIQPGRQPEDVFPTRYRLNTPQAIRKAFPDADVFVSRAASEPAYHFGSPLVYRLVRWVNKHLPDSLQPTLYVYIRKR